MGWFGIIRLGLVNAALGAVVTLSTITLNRVMVVELALPALVPGALVALHYALQLLRPRLGFGSDVGGRRTPWIVGGLAVLCAGGLLAACATALMARALPAGLALAVLAYTAVGVGVGAVGTSSLVLLATQTAPARRPAAATIFWVLMILGAVVTAGLTSAVLKPFSFALLLRVGAGVAAASFLLGLAAIAGLEAGGRVPAPAAARHDFLAALREVWREEKARRFAIFVFVSMLAYSGQELILEPFAGLVLALDASHTAALSSLHQQGLLGGMLLVAVGGTAAARFARGNAARAMRWWTIGGCAVSGLALLGLVAACAVGPAWPVAANIAVLGVANGAFAVSAIGAMMGLAGGGGAGTRMGLWGAAQAIAMGAGGLLSSSSSDLARALLGSPSAAYAAVFVFQAVMFLAAARLAGSIFQTEPAPRGAPQGELAAA